MDTKLVKILYIDEDETSYLSEPYLLKIAAIIPEIKKMLQERWVFMENKQVFYDNEVVALYPDLNFYKCSYTSERTISAIDEKILDFSNFTGDFMTLDEVRTSFNKDLNFPFKFSNYSIKYDGISSHYYMGYKKDAMLLDGFNLSNNSAGYTTGVIMPIFRLNGEDSKPVDDNHVLFLWLKNDLIPKKLPKETMIIYKELLEWSNSLTYQDNEIIFDKKLVLEQVKTNKSTIKYLSNRAVDKLLNCEKYRADIESYDEKILTDPNRGHWDLWEQAPDDNLIMIEVEEEFVARNPQVDIKAGGVIAIDFGTKSTVVIHQEDSDHTLPMRVGTGQFSERIEDKHYENPTVMEFINIEHFLKRYRERIGRPDTLWEDITVSHTALSSLLSSSSDNYYTVLSDLKQWAGDKQKQIRLKDKMGKDIILPKFLALTDEDVNPIELYAYYLGLYINNQHTGIYLDYTLSFPVTYEKEIRTKILESFSQGLKKSLPISLHNDEEVIKIFRVASGASEPTAYAICALQEYGFKPKDNEKILYGVFDFGGGTTDFDFGIWREAGPKERRYDYVIEHFGAGGDRYLGGENLLELLAFEVFKANQDKLRDAGICFSLPPECKKFAGCELLLNDSQEANLNIKQVMEKLRPLWEKHEKYVKELDNGLIKVNLFDRVGHVKANFELNVIRNDLEKLVEVRIEKGVRNFFEALRHSFANDNPSETEKIYIFLAGNSSKSKIVTELFNQYIQAEIKNNASDKKQARKYFEIFPPLGTEEAERCQGERGLNSKEELVIKPTGKTGVAFGLLKSRKGGKIKVIDRNVEEDEIKFKYFIGESKKGRFNVIVDRNNDYQKWYDFIDANEEDFEIYYTDLPEASNNQMEIQDIKRKKCKIDITDEQASVFVRTVTPTMIEYVVATEEGIQQEEYLGEIKQLELN